MKTLTNLSFRDMAKTAVVALMFAGLMLTASGALAHGTHSTSALADSCLLRAAVDATEANQLTGKAAGAHPSGTYLSLAVQAEAGDHGLICTYGLVKFATNLLLAVVLVVATLLIAYAAFLFVTAGQSPEKRTKARDFLLFAIVGLVVAAVASLIPTIVRGLLGV